MRHAKSSWKYPDLSDHERPLNKRGRKASVKIAKELIQLNWIPNKLYSSDYERTKETWKRMNKHMKNVDVEYSRKFYHSKPKKIMKNIIKYVVNIKLNHCEYLPHHYLPQSTSEHIQDHLQLNIPEKQKMYN